jgi:carbon-monoxide dehydrogenase large subunit
VVFQNKVPTCQYRGVGHPIACAVTEALVDGIAGKLGMDPIAFRQMNVIPDDAYPATGASGIKLELLSHEQCLRDAKRAVRLRRPARRPGRAAHQGSTAASAWPR